MPEPTAPDPKRKKALARLGLLLAAILLPLGVAEAVLRNLPGPKLRPAVASICGDCPYVYGLNPAYGDVSPQGFVGSKTYATPKPPGTSRILVLGDSVAFGYGINEGRVEKAFPALLEGSLAKGGPVEVVNSGVPGYSAFNERELYLAKGKALSPDVVVLQSCMNDVADPENHWFLMVPRSQRAKRHVPPEAVPNPEYHERVVVPRDQALRKPPPRRSLPYRAVAKTALGQRLLLLFADKRPPPPAVSLGGKSWPVDITGEDDLSIQVLTDETTAESRWLRGQWEKLGAAVSADGGTLVILIMPLLTQLEDGYPFLPQEQLLRFCQDKGILCLDPLPALRKHRDEKVFLGQEPPGDPPVRDIWHLSPRGHAVVAEEIASFLSAHGLPKRP
ncbi:MAG: GDSL-type esterase/lipase family protein [Byssovorax sp.]